jgi:ankyrin repeat protein
MAMRKPLWTLTVVFLLALPAAGQNLKLPETRNISQVLKQDSQRAGISVKGKDESVPPLIWAVDLGRTEAVRALLEKGADVNAARKDGVTALMIAASAGDRATVRYLLEKGANVNAKDEYQWTPLFSAAFAGRTDVVRTLLDKGANINDVDRVGQTALMVAAVGGHTNTVCALAQSGVDVDAKDKDGRTALMYAADLGHTDTVRALLERGADAAARNAEGATALQLAQKNKYPALVALLSSQAIHSTGPLNKIVNTPDAAIVLANYPLTRLPGPLPSSPDHGQRASKTLLGTAETGDPAKVQHLLKQGENTRARRSSAARALIGTAVVGEMGSGRALLEKDADGNAKVNAGETVEVSLVPDKQPIAQGGTIERAELAQVPPGQAVVTYLDGELTIRASNARLGDILNAVCEKIGAILDLPSVPNERMFANLGPGRPREVLSSLLNNAQLDFVFASAADDPNALERVMVFPRAKDSSVGERVPQSQVAENRVAQNQASQPSVGTSPEASAPKDSDVQQQMKEALAQVRAEIAKSSDNDPEIMRLLDEQMKAAEAAQVDPSQTQASSPAPVSTAGRSRHRRR